MPYQKNVLVTGATGFVGKALCDCLRKQSYVVKTTARIANHGIDYQITSIDRHTDWADILNDIDVVIHLAARVHVMQEQLADPLAAYRETNVEGTLNLARQAAIAKVQRFIYLSSIGVNGNQTCNVPFSEISEPNPQNSYAISKYEAEQGLMAIAQEMGMETVIIRPPLVYGPYAKGNFASMVKWSKSGLPLPLGAVHNQRSFVALDNLIDLMMICIHHPAAIDQIFLVSDGEDISTSDLFRRFAKAGGFPSSLIPVPTSWLNIGLNMVGGKMIAQQLLGSLQVDISKAREVLGWTPPISVDEGLKRCFPIKG